MALRWSATGPFVNLFPILVAFLEISAAGAGQSQIALIGSYKPPLGPAGELLDRAVLHKAGLVTIRRWLRAASAAATSSRSASRWASRAHSRNGCASASRTCGCSPSTPPRSPEVP